MDHLARHSIVHRDLAARNVLVDAANTCMVADFGLARTTQNKSGPSGGEYCYYRTNTGVFPARWTAPEAIADSKYTTMSDVRTPMALLWRRGARVSAANARITADPQTHNLRACVPTGSGASLGALALR